MEDLLRDHFDIPDEKQIIDVYYDKNREIINFKVIPSRFEVAEGTEIPSVTYEARQRTRRCDTCPDRLYGNLFQREE